MTMPTYQEIASGQLDQKIQQAAAGTNAGATATEAAVVGKKHMITSLDGWSDAASLIQILDDTTVIKEWKLLADTPFSKEFFPPLEISADKLASGKIAASTADCHVSIDGFTVNEGA